MKKLLVLLILGSLSIFKADAQQKKTSTTTKAVKEVPSETKPSTETTASSEKAPETKSATEEKKMESNVILSQSDLLGSGQAEDRTQMSFDDVYTNYKEKIDNIEKEINEKKLGIQKDNSLSSELKKKKMEEYNAYRKQLLVDIFGQKNFEQYEKSLKH